MPPKTYVYVDGFNLYYGAVKDTPYKWLDIRKLCELMLKDHAIHKVKYFTAKVHGHVGDPRAPQRQQIFLRALATIPDFEIIYGSFSSHNRTMRLANPSPGGPSFATVIHTEEKGSDVNLGTHLVHDANQGRFGTAAVISNDSDLREPIRIVRDELHLPVVVLNPFGGHSSLALGQYANTRQIRTGVLQASQFPATLQDAHGQILKPPSWY